MRTEIVPTLAGEIEITLPTSKKEITLEQFIKFSQLKLDESILNQEMEECKFRFDIEDVLEDDPETVYSMAHLNADKARIINSLEEVYADLLRAVLGAEEDYVVDLLPHKTLYALANSITVEEEVPSIQYFHFPEATKPDIDRLETERNKILTFYSITNSRLKESGDKMVDISLEDRKRLHDIDQQVEVLKLGKFNALPAERILFETRIQLDTINRNLPLIPPNIKKDLEDKGYTLDSYIKNLVHWEELETLKEKKERFKLEEQIQKYVSEYGSGMYDRAVRIMAHVCIPEGMTYSYEKAEQRVPYLLKLDMYTVDGILGFFLDLREILIKDTALSLMKKEHLKLRKLKTM